MRASTEALLLLLASACPPLPTRYSVVKTLPFTLSPPLLPLPSSILSDNHHFPPLLCFLTGSGAEGGNHPSWFQGPSILHASSFQNIPVWCEVKLCKTLFERKEEKRKGLVKMRLLDHILNEVQLKVVFVQSKEKPLQIR